MARVLALFLTGLALAAPAAADDDRVRIAGHVDVTEAVDGSLHAAGGRITIQAPVDGDASLVGGRIEVTGPVMRDLRAAAGHVTIDGPVGGDVSVAAGRLELGPQARISGKLTFHGGDFDPDAAAVVQGGIRKSTRHEQVHFHSAHPEGLGWAWTAGLLVLAMLIAAAMPGATARMSQELRDRPWMTVLVGLVALTTIPVAAALLMVTIIGIPLGLLAIAGYAVLLLVGYVWLAVAIGGLLLDRARPETAAATAWRAGAAALAMLALAVLTRMPFVGGFFVFAALVTGVGMVVAAMMRRANPAPAAA